MYIWKIATIILSFVMIVGLWSGITLDAKAEETQKITEVELIVRAPKAGEDLATVENGSVSVSTQGVKVPDVKWCKGCLLFTSQWYRGRHGFRYSNHKKC